MAIEATQNNRDVGQHVSKSADIVSDMFDNLIDAQKAQQENTEKGNEIRAEYDALQTDVENAFSVVPNDEAALDSENFNAIVNSLINSNTLASTEETDLLKNYILATMGINPADIDNMTNEEMADFMLRLTEVLIGHNGSNDDLSNREFEAIIEAINDGEIL